MDAQDIYDAVSRRLGSEHPLLTRPVLVNRLLSVVRSAGELNNIESALASSSEYFPNFIDAIIVREAESKWIDTSGEPAKPLISIKEHYEILATIAEEMWLTSTDSLDLSIVDLLSDLYCDSKGHSVRISRQIKERLKQHALLVRSDQNSNHLKFDHEAFQDYFLGIAFFDNLRNARIPELKNLLRKGSIPDQTVETIAVNCRRENLEFPNVVKTINFAQVNEGPTSFVKENCGKMALVILAGKNTADIILENYIFPVNSMNALSLSDIFFFKCHFQITSMAQSLSNCKFEKCTFDGIEIVDEEIRINNVLFLDTQILSVQLRSKDTSYYDPFHVESEMEKLGILIDNSKPDLEISNVLDEPEVDENLELTERVLRRFIRSSFINDNVFRVRLGAKAPKFINEILPVLLRSGLLSELDFSGQGQKRRFKLTTPFERINRALEESKGSFDSFISQIKRLNNRQ